MGGVRCATPEQHVGRTGVTVGCLAKNQQPFDRSD